MNKALVQLFVYTCSVAIILFLTGWLFYQNVVLSIILASGAVFYPRIKKRQLEQKRRQELGYQFNQLLQSLVTSLSAGKSLEQAFVVAEEDLLRQYLSEKTLILQELKWINRRVRGKEPIEKVFAEFAQSSGLEDIQSFADVLAACKRTGGDIGTVIRRTSKLISEKRELLQELQVTIAQKRFEAKVIGVAPFGMVALLNWTASQYMQPLYAWPGMGPFIMTFGLLLFVSAFYLSHRIMAIQV